MNKESKVEFSQASICLFIWSAFEGSSSFSSSVTSVNSVACRKRRRLCKERSFSWVNKLIESSESTNIWLSGTQGMMAQKRFHNVLRPMLPWYSSLDISAENSLYFGNLICNYRTSSLARCISISSAKYSERFVLRVASSWYSVLKLESPIYSKEDRMSMRIPCF